MATRLLCAGDMHIGRRPTGLTPEAEDQVDRSALSPAAVWHRVVEVAIELEVDAVLLAGDVVEQRDDVYEALGVLSAGVKRLVGKGIPVIGVAGNHDGIVLPRLADAIPEFRLLGRDKTWESVLVTGKDGPDTRILGWSFSGEHVATDPLADLPPIDRDGSPTLGLLHCDLDASGSRYAPVRTSALADADVDAWLLGHIHNPDPLEGPRPIGYLGAVAALDPSDEGARGPWLVQVEGDGRIEARQLPLAPLRFEPVTIDVGQLVEAGDLPTLVTGTVNRLHAELGSTEHRPVAVGLRIRIEGRTALRATLREQIDLLRELVLPLDGIDYFVQKVTNASRPTRDLDQIATGGMDPYSLLAARLLILDRHPEDPERRELLRRARSVVEATRGKRTYTRLAPPHLDDEAIAELLKDAALATMDALELQREGMS